MPFVRLTDRAIREEKRQRQEKQDWLLGNWIIARSVADIMLSEREKPYHPSEKPPEPGVGQVRESRQALEEQQKLIGLSHANPAHFGARHGIPHVFGEPERRIEAAKPRDVRKEIEEREKRLLDSLRLTRETSGDYL